MSINSTNTGGGIYNGGTLTLSNSTVSDNTVTGSNSIGGGIYNSSDMMLNISNSTVSGNTATGSNSDGGGIYNSGTLTLSNSTVSGNTAPDGAGGGILIQGDTSGPSHALAD